MSIVKNQFLRSSYIHKHRTISFCLYLFHGCRVRHCRCCMWPNSELDLLSCIVNESRAGRPQFPKDLKIPPIHRYSFAGRCGNKSRRSPLICWWGESDDDWAKLWEIGIGDDCNRDEFAKIIEITTINWPNLVQIAIKWWKCQVWFGWAIPLKDSNKTTNFQKRMVWGSQG